MPKIVTLCLNLSKLCPEYCGLFFPDTVYMCERKGPANPQLSYAEKLQTRDTERTHVVLVFFQAKRHTQTVSFTLCEKLAQWHAGVYRVCNFSCANTPSVSMCAHVYRVSICMNCVQKSHKPMTCTKLMTS